MIKAGSEQGSGLSPRNPYRRLLPLRSGASPSCPGRFLHLGDQLLKGGSWSLLMLGQVDSRLPQAGEVGHTVGSASKDVGHVAADVGRGAVKTVKAAPKVYMQLAKPVGVVVAKTYNTAAQVMDHTPLKVFSPISRATSPGQRARTRPRLGPSWVPGPFFWAAAFRPCCTTAARPRGPGR